MACRGGYMVCKRGGHVGRPEALMACTDGTDGGTDGVLTQKASAYF